MSKKPYLFLATATIIALASCGGSDSPGGIPEIPTAEKNANANNPKTSRKEVTRLEFPHLKGNGSIVLVHKTNDSYDPDGVNYAVEWDTSLKAQRWTCYQMHKERLATTAHSRKIPSCPATPASPIRMPCTPDRDSPAGTSVHRQTDNIRAPPTYKPSTTPTCNPNTIISMQGKTTREYG